MRHFRAPRPHRQKHRRRDAGGICQRRGCGRLRGQDSAQHGRAQRGYPSGTTNRVSDRNQRRRHHHRWRRHLRRRRQHRGTPGNALRTRRGMHLEGGERPDQGQAVDGFRRSGRAGREEHLARGRRIRAYRQGHRGHSGSRNSLICGRRRDDQPFGTNRKFTSARPATACSLPTPGRARVIRWSKPATG